MKYLVLILSMVTALHGEVIFKYRIPSSHWQNIEVQVVAVDNDNELLGISADCRDFLKITDGEAKKLVKELELIRKFSRGVQQVQVAVWKARAKKGEVLKLTMPAIDILERRSAMLLDIVEVLGEQRGKFFYLKFIQQAVGIPCLQGVGAPNMMYSFNDDGAVSRLVWKGLVSDVSEFEQDIENSTLLGKKKLKPLSSKSGGGDGLCAAVFDGDLLITDLGVCDVDLFDRVNGVNRECVAMFPLSLNKQEELILYLEVKRLEYLKRLKPLIKKEEDKLGGMLIHIPEHRKWGQAFAKEMLSEIEKKFGEEVADFFSGMDNFDANGYSAAPYRMGDTFYQFGERKSYVIRGGKKEYRLEVIPMGALWVQFAEGDEDIRSAYDCTTLIDVYEEFPLYLRALVTGAELKEFKGRGHYEMQRMIRAGLIDEATYNKLKGAMNMEPDVFP